MIRGLQRGGVPLRVASGCTRASRHLPPAAAGRLRTSHTPSSPSRSFLKGARRAKAPMSQEAVAAGIEQLEGLIPGFQISPEAMKAADWVRARVWGD